MPSFTGSIMGLSAETTTVKAVPFSHALAVMKLKENAGPSAALSIPTISISNDFKQGVVLRVCQQLPLQQN